MTSSIATRPPYSCEVSQLSIGRAAVISSSLSLWRKTTPSSITKPRSSHHSVYAARPGRRTLRSRTTTPDKKSTASGPVIRYLKSGEVSKIPTPLRTAKYSCLGAWEKRSADR